MKNTKKKIGIIFIIFSILFYSTCKKELSQVVIIPSFGTIEVPNDWIITSMDDIIYMTDLPISNIEHNIFLAVVNRVWGEDRSYYYEYFEYAEPLGYIRGGIHSNDTEHRLVKFVIDGTVVEKYVIYLHKRRGTTNATIYLISVDNLISEDMIIKIAKSFEILLDFYE